MIRSLRRALQEADFNVRQTKEITERLETRMREEEPRPGINLQTHALNILYTELVRLLGLKRNLFASSNHIAYGWPIWSRERQQPRPN